MPCLFSSAASRFTASHRQVAADRKKRFNEIARENHINPRKLRERLKVLEEEGAVTRTVISTLPPNVEYELTEKGKALNCIFEALANWGRTWMAPKPCARDVVNPQGEDNS